MLDESDDVGGTVGLLYGGLYFFTLTSLNCGPPHHSTHPTLLPVGTTGKGKGHRVTVLYFVMKGQKKVGDELKLGTNRVYVSRTRSCSLPTYCL